MLPPKAKPDLRREMRGLLLAISADQRAQASLQICAHAARRTEFHAACSVAFFASLPTEPDIRALIEEAWAERKRVALPFVLNRDEPAMAWHAVSSWDQLYARGPHGLLEPDPKICPVVTASELDLVFVPGLAFDSEGNRLGRGGGFYDRFLAGMPGVPAIGLFFALQQVERIPREAHDHPLTSVITENG